MTCKIAAAAIAALSLSACTTIDELPTDRVGQAQLNFANGLPAGTAQLLNNGGNLSLAVAATGIAPGEHGFHLHMTGRCEAPDFSSAGGHLNPAGRDHGSMDPGGKHLGDLPNLSVGESRTATAEFDIEGAPEEVLEEIFDADGTAVVLHAGPDDYRTDPSGNSGARIACGVLTQS